MREDLPELERPPSEYIRDHVWITTQPIEEPDDPEQLIQAIRHAQLGDRLLFATDYPHWDFDSPAQALPRAMPTDLRRAIRADNAAQLYGLPLSRR
jgi:predicted TIM-barrel fold metal-dependent hydrolase